MFKPDYKGSETQGCLAQLSLHTFSVKPTTAHFSWNMLLQKKAHNLSIAWVHQGYDTADPEYEASHSLFQEVCFLHFADL